MRPSGEWPVTAGQPRNPSGQRVRHALRKGAKVNKDDYFLAAAGVASLLSQARGPRCKLHTQGKGGGAAQVETQGSAPHCSAQEEVCPLQVCKCSN